MHTWESKHTYRKWPERMWMHTWAVIHEALSRSDVSAQLRNNFEHVIEQDTSIMYHNQIDLSVNQSISHICGAPSKPVYFAWINVIDSIISELWKVQETWSSVLSEFAFWFWAEVDSAIRECLTSQAVWGIWIVGCGCSLGKRYQRIRTYLTGEVESPSSHIQRHFS